MKGTDYFAENLGIKVLESKDGYAKAQMKIEKKHTNALGFTHGGAIFSLGGLRFRTCMQLRRQCGGGSSSQHKLSATIS